ncbi:tyrosine-type recombinase/integrase [Paenibacillus graminis]|uniref:tyrosine-type recombinase/integrase n=2 Tax=Paenibacillus graminis TaxID=189425 RepID=UPI002DBDD497|nr:site-specific integrase [Paenibacillus graminis]MEC0173010.1 site-specific integrase [Paenibacillus graminis]
MARKYPKVRSRNGLHTYRYDITDPQTGERIQKETPSYPTAKEAYQAGIRIEEEIRNGTYIEESKLSVSEWSEKFLVIYASTGKVKNRTVDIRGDSLKIVNRKIGGLTLSEITLLQYQTMLNELKEEGYSKGSIKIIHAAGCLMFRKAVTLKVIKNDPTKEAEIPAFQETVEDIENNSELPQYLEKEQLALLLRTAKESGSVQGFNAVFLLAYTGMRIGELCALKISDIDEVNKKISITKTLYQRHGISAFGLNTPKSKSSIRKIDVSETVLKVLRNQEIWRNKFKMSRRDEYYKDAEFVFINELLLPGWPAASRTIDEFMKKMLKAAGLPTTLTPHSLRHTYTSLMAEAGVELPAIKKLLGHKKDGVTEAVYLHVTESKKRAAVEKLDQLMEGLL